MFAELDPPYSTIVVDPPWPYETQPTGYQRESGKRSFLPYSTMTVDEVKALPIGDVAVLDAHLYLWTTQRFVWDAVDVVEGWGFQDPQLLVWCKTPTGAMTGGAFAPTCEFLLFARRNHGPLLKAMWQDAGYTPAEIHREVRGGRQTGLVSMWAKGTRYPSEGDWERMHNLLPKGIDHRAGPPRATIDSTWFQWPRGPHSAKPAAAYDLIERVSPGPYVDIFARATRLGWDSWGKGYEG